MLLAVLIISTLCGIALTWIYITVDAKIKELIEKRKSFAKKSVIMLGGKKSA